VEPKIRSGICLNTHPEGCRAETLSWIDAVRAEPPLTGGPRFALVLGSSGGYGLASRIVSAFTYGAATIGVAWEKEPTGTKQGTSGFYNTEAFDAAAAETGLFSLSFNGDAFSAEMKERVAEAVLRGPGRLDLVVYSLASPVRAEPSTGTVYRSVLKPIGKPYRSKTVDPFTGTLSEVSIEPASAEEIEATRKVMGGEDWELWIRTLLDAGCLAPGIRTVAYSYIGPEVTYPVYREGTIGKAKEHLEATASAITKLLEPAGGSAFVSVNKALVTKASAVIPVVPLYISILFAVMKRRGIHEGCVEQIHRRFTRFLYAGGPVPVDDKGRIRIDDLEMREDVQREVAGIWGEIDGNTLREKADIEGYVNDFYRLNGFAVPGVDYTSGEDRG